MPGVTFPRSVPASIDIPDDAVVGPKAALKYYNSKIDSKKSQYSKDETIDTKEINDSKKSMTPGVTFRKSVPATKEIPVDVVECTLNDYNSTKISSPIAKDTPNFDEVDESSISYIDKIRECVVEKQERHSNDEDNDKEETTFFPCMG